MRKPYLLRPGESFSTCLKGNSKVITVTSLFILSSATSQIIISLDTRDLQFFSFLTTSQYLHTYRQLLFAQVKYHWTVYHSVNRLRLVT